MKKYLSIGLLLLVGVTYWYYSHKIEITDEPLQKNSEMAIVASTTRYTTARGWYPQFTNTSDAFNAKIKNAIQKGVVEHAKMSEDNWKARYETSTKDEKIKEFPDNNERFEYIASSTIVRNDERVISVIIRVYEFSGGAHGSEAILTFNYDVVGKKEITLNDLMKGDTLFLQKLSKVSRELLRQKFASSSQQVNIEMLNDGTKASMTNFSLFTLPTDNEAIFYFTQYQVAPYVFGSSDITVPLPLK